ncbi:Translin family protein [Zea mays]|uniref:Translin family protein n=1 Tax=Zea mays TaxID=4577 RepID=A0A1D6FBI3_MAIZE|nr:Translin family protein [Zea mays]
MVLLRVCRHFGHLRFASFLSMAAPQQSAPLSGSAPKRLRAMATDAAAVPNPPASSGCPAMKAEFAKHAEYLNTLNDKRERLVKASRDITMNSKKVIFQVHRITKVNRDEVLSKAENDLAAVVNQYIAKLVKELQGTDFWKLRRAYTFGVQEYVEAATLCRFCKTGTLLSLAEINDSLLALSGQSVEPLQLNVLDYLLGVADLSGELMRLAIGRISDGEVEYAKTICAFVRDIYRELTLVVPLMDDNSEMKKKMEVMLQSVVKIENGIISLMPGRVNIFYSLV